MTDLATSLHAQLDEEERRANAAIHAGLGVDLGPDGKILSEYPDVQDHIATWYPARVLAEVEAKRQIIELHVGVHDCPEMHTGTYPDDWPEGASWGSPGAQWRHASSEHFADNPCPTLRLLAQLYGL